MLLIDYIHCTSNIVKSAILLCSCLNSREKYAFIFCSKIYFLDHVNLIDPFKELDRFSCISCLHIELRLHHGGYITRLCEHI